MACKVCTHNERLQIEEALLTIQYTPSPSPSLDTPDSSDSSHDSQGTDAPVSITIESVSERYGIPVQDLQVHMIMHQPKAVLHDPELDSIAQEIKKVEGNYLTSVIEEYMVTLRQSGRTVRKHLQDSKGLYLKAETVNTYLGTGNQIRQTVAQLVDMNIKINGEGDQGMNALVQMVTALRSPSANNTNNTNND